MRDAEFEAALCRLEEYRERAAEAVKGVDLLLAPTLAFVAPPAVRDDLEIREAVIRFTYPFNALESRDACSRTDEDARVLAAGAPLERARAARLRGTVES